LIDLIGIPLLARIPAIRQTKEFVDASQIVIQRVFNGLAAMDRLKEIKPDPQIAEENKVPIVNLLLELQEIVTDPQYSALVREAVIDLFTKNLMHMDGGLPRGWSWRFTENRGDVIDSIF
jgi:hypothetical protein